MKIDSPCSTTLIESCNHTESRCIFVMYVVSVLTRSTSTIFVVVQLVSIIIATTAAITIPISIVHQQPL